MLFLFSCYLADGDKPVEGSDSNKKKLGPAGIALHYATIITQIDTLVSFCHLHSQISLNNTVFMFCVSWHLIILNFLFFYEVGERVKKEREK